MSTFVSISDARVAKGLRLVTVGGVPSPWAEAAKGIFQIKGLPFLRAKQAKSDPPNALVGWAGDSTVPVVAYENEKLRTGWVEILLLAERLSMQPSLVPVDTRQRALMFGLAHEICGEMGLGWCLRLVMFRNALGHGSGTSLPPQIAAELAPKYGFEPSAVAQAEARVVAILRMLAEQLGDQRYYLGDQLCALDVYWATFSQLLIPLPEDEMTMWPPMRAAYTATDEKIVAALTPSLRRHQRMMFTTHLELPVRL